MPVGGTGVAPELILVGFGGGARPQNVLDELHAAGHVQNNAAVFAMAFAQAEIHVQLDSGGQRGAHVPVPAPGWRISDDTFDPVLSSWLLTGRQHEGLTGRHHNPGRFFIFHRSKMRDWIELNQINIW